MAIIDKAGEEIEVIRDKAGEGIEAIIGKAGEGIEAVLNTATEEVEGPRVESRPQQDTRLSLGRNWQS